MSNQTIPPPILFIGLATNDRSDGDGGDIFDRKLIAGLSAAGHDVELFRIPRQRRLSVPFWQNAVSADVQAALHRFDKRHRLIICSHESIFHALGEIPADLVIVHNYFPRFSFPGKRLLESYYRLGSKRYFLKSFIGASKVAFVSHRDMKLAVADWPKIQDRSVCIQPPPYEVELGRRRWDVIHVSGSDTWLPKRLSRLSSAQVEELKKSGFLIRDFGPDFFPAFGLINDRFVVGFKLKLMQMIYCRDVIASYCDLREEIESIAPNYPFYRQVSGHREVIQFFNDVRQSRSIESVDQLFAKSARGWKIPTWNQLGHQLSGYLNA